MSTLSELKKELSKLKKKEEKQKKELQERLDKEKVQKEEISSYNDKIRKKRKRFLYGYFLYLFIVPNLPFIPLSHQGEFNNNLLYALTFAPLLYRFIFSKNFQFKESPLSDSVSGKYSNRDNMGTTARRLLKSLDSQKESIEIQKEISEIERQIEELKIEKKNEEDRKKREIKFREKYPNLSDNRISKMIMGGYWIGMSRTQLIESRGRPSEIKKTSTANIRKEKFYYDPRKSRLKTIVYRLEISLKNGKVVGFKDL